MSINRHIPTLIQPLLEDYIALVDQQLPEWISSFYLIGSIALGEFNEHFSDIDFVAVLHQTATSEAIQELRNIHRIVERDYPRWKMSGSYIQSSDLGKTEEEISPHLHYHDGILHSNGRSGLNLITWWELKNHGIAILGDEPSTLPFTVDWDLLVTKGRENMNSYWARWTNRPGRILLLYSNWGIQWAVLGVLRQLYTFQENSITTKVRAAQYALGCLPDRWHMLIQEAIHIRQGKKSAYRFRIVRMVEAVSFLKYILQLCNRSYPLK